MSLSVAVTCFPKDTASIQQNEETFLRPTNLLPKLLFLTKRNNHKDRLGRRHARKGGDVSCISQTLSPQRTFGRNVLGRGDFFLKNPKHISPEAHQRLRKTSLDEPPARKGGDVFPETPLAHPSPRPNSTRSPQTRGRRFYHTPKASRRMHRERHLEGCTKTTRRMHRKNITKDAHQNAPRRIPKTKQLSETIARTVRRLSRVTTKVSTVKLQRITTGPAQVLCHAASGTSKAENLPAHQWHSAVHILHHGNIYKPST